MRQHVHLVGPIPFVVEIANGDAGILGGERSRQRSGSEHAKHAERAGETTHQTILVCTPAQNSSGSGAEPYAGHAPLSFQGSKATGSARRIVPSRSTRQ